MYLPRSLSPTAVAWPGQARWRLQEVYLPVFLSPWPGSLGEFFTWVCWSMPVLLDPYWVPDPERIRFLSYSTIDPWLILLRG